MSRRPTVLSGLTIGVLAAAACLALASPASAQQDKNAEKNLRRMQLQLQQTQQQLQEAQAAKTQAESARAALEKQLAGQAKELPKVQGVLRKAGDELKASEAARTELTSQLAARDQRVSALEAQLAALDTTLANQRVAAEDALLKRDRDLALLRQTAVARETAQTQAQAQLQALHDAWKTQATDCSDKNGRLIRLNASLIERYRNKGVIDSLRQGEPLLGLGEVEWFNRLQDERDKAEAERHRPDPIADRGADAVRAAPAN